jgi:TolB protein
LEDAIVVMRADGSDPIELTDGSIGGSGPLWSPDGTRVLFGIFFEGVAVVNADGSGFKMLTEGDVQGYAWSPDGKRVAFGRGSFDDPGAVYTINADGTQPVNLTGDEADAAYQVFAWSPDGKWIAFVRDSGSARDRSDIYLAAADGSAPPVNLTQRPGRYGSVAWSPTGTTIAFARSLVPGEDASFFEQDVCTINADGTGLRQLTNDPTLYEGIAWSPDGTKLVFDKLGEGLFIMNPDGSAMRRLTTGEGVAVEPAWRP